MALQCFIVYFHLFFLWLLRKKIKKKGNVIKFKKNKLYGGKLNEVITPNKKGEK